MPWRVKRPKQHQAQRVCLTDNVIVRPVYSYTCIAIILQYTCMYVYCCVHVYLLSQYFNNMAYYGILYITGTRVRIDTRVLQLYVLELLEYRYTRIRTRVYTCIAIRVLRVAS